MRIEASATLRSRNTELVYQARAASWSRIRATMNTVCFGAAVPLRTCSRLATRHVSHAQTCSPLQMKEASKKRKAAPARTNASSGLGFGRATPKQFKYTGRLRPGKISPKRPVPDGIPRPDYARDGTPRAKQPKFPWNIEVKTPEEIEKMRVSGRLAREVLDIAGQAVAVGVTTDKIDEIVHQAIVERNAYPSPLYYQKFPKSCCTSVNEVVCHGIPDSTVLQDGDIVNIDITVYHDGYHGDCSEMFLVGNVDDEGKRLVRTTYECMDRAIEMCKPDIPIKRIGGVIEEHAKANDFTVVRNFCGHGIGSVFHTTPNVMHFKNDEPAGVMKPGITFTIEPMINEGSAKNVTWPDDWTATTVDGKRSAQFEHTILITEDGVERLTGKLPTSPKFFWEA